jgi:hypothetical protein
VLRDINGLGNFAGYLIAALFVEALLNAQQLQLARLPNKKMTTFASKSDVLSL